MPHADDRQRRSILQRIAHRVMLERGLVPDFPLPALAEFDAIHRSVTRVEESTRDLRNLPWCSIDNDDSDDLDQLTVAEAIPDGATKVLVATADVDTVVKKRSGLDDHPNAGTGSSSLPQSGASRFPRSPIPRPWSSSWNRRKPRILSVFPISVSASSSCWEPVNTSSNYWKAVQSGILVLRSGIIPTLQPRTADTPI
jgi:hypothetical protein